MNIILTVQEDHKIEVVRDLLCEAMRKSRNERVVSDSMSINRNPNPNEFT